MLLFIMQLQKSKIIGYWLKFMNPKLFDCRHMLNITRQSKIIYRTLITLLITIAIFWIIFSKVNIGQTIEVVTGANILLILLSLVISVCTNIIFSSHVWMQILKQFGYNITYRESIIINASVIPVLTVIPLKLGHFVKSIYLKKYNNIPIKISAASVTLHLIMGIINIILIILVSSFILVSSVNQLIIVCILFLTFFIVILKRKWIEQFILNVIEKSCHLKKVVSKLSYVSSINMKCGGAYKNIFKISVYCFLNKLLIIVNYYIIFLSVGIYIPFIEYVLFMSITIILCQLPLTISGFGARESLILIFFANYASYESLLGAGLLISVIDYIYPAIIGAFFMNKSDKMLVKCKQSGSTNCQMRKKT